MSRTSQKVISVDSSGNPIGGSALAGYETANKDDQAGTSYYGFLDSTGNWYIQSVDINNILYIKGSSGYAAAWTGRAGLTYLPFDQIF